MSVTEYVRNSTNSFFSSSSSPHLRFLLSAEQQTFTFGTPLYVSEIINFKDIGAIRYEWMHFAVSLAGPKITSSTSLHNCCLQTTHPATLELLKGRCRSTSHQMPKAMLIPGALGAGSAPSLTGQPPTQRQPERGHNPPLHCLQTAQLTQIKEWEQTQGGEGRGIPRFQLWWIQDRRSPSMSSLNHMSW